MSLPEPRDAGDPVLSLRDVAVLRDDRWLLDGVNLDLRRGEIAVLTGPSGSGKTTLLRAAAGLIDTDRGDVQRPNPAPSRAQPWALVRQQPENQLVAGTVEEELAFGLTFANLPEHEIRRRVDGALARFSLTEQRSLPPHALSGGTMQRLAIAAAWVLEPRLWLLDEPTSYLDATSRLNLHEWLPLMAERAGVLWVASDPGEIRLGTRLLLLENGRITADGTPDDVLNSPVFAAAGLERPRMDLLRAVRDPVADFHLPEAVDFPSHTVPSPEPGAGVVLSVRDLRARRRSLFSPEREVLRGVSLDLYAGECVALTGAAGAGKTTLLEALAGVIEVSGGQVDRTGLNSEDEGGHRGVGLAFQFPERGFFAETVLDEVAYGPMNQALSADEAVARARRALRRVGLKPDVFATRNPFALSGGEARRVALAGVLALQPRVLLLDEPTAGLDSRDTATLLTLLREECARGTAVILSGHDHDRLGDLCGRWLRMEDGRIVHDGDPRALWAERTSSAGLPPPATVRAWRDAGLDLETMPGLPLGAVLGDARFAAARPRDRA